MGISRSISRGEVFGFNNLISPFFFFFKFHVYFWAPSPSVMIVRIVNKYPLSPKPPIRKSFNLLTLFGVCISVLEWNIIRENKKKKNSCWEERCISITMKGRTEGVLWFKMELEILSTISLFPKNLILSKVN